MTRQRTRRGKAPGPLLPLEAAPRPFTLTEEFGQGDPVAIIKRVRSKKFIRGLELRYLLYALAQGGAARSIAQRLDRAFVHAIMTLSRVQKNSGYFVACEFVVQLDTGLSGLTGRTGQTRRTERWYCRYCGGMNGDLATAAKHAWGHVFYPPRKMIEALDRVENPEETVDGRRVGR